MDCIGIDAHKVNSLICMITQDGELVENRIRTDRQRFAEVLGKRPRARILIEASTESEWIAQCLEELGHELIVADPNYAPMYSTRSRRIKTDRRDGRALAEACRNGTYRPGHRASGEQRHVRARLAVRDGLVKTRTRYIGLISALVRGNGYRIPTGAPKTFAERVRRVGLPGRLLSEVAPLLAALVAVNAQIGFSDRELARIRERDEVVRRLTGVRGVGPVTAVTLRARLDDPGRFVSAGQVSSYLGLVPSEQSSGEKQQRGRITKAGHSETRSLLVEAAWGILRSNDPQTEPLKKWAQRIAERRGSRIAAVALARRLSRILFAMWRDGTDFDRSKLERNVSPEPAAQAA